MKKGKKDNISTIKNLICMLRIAQKYIPLFCILFWIVRAFLGIFDAFYGVYLMKFIIDSVQFDRPISIVFLFLFSYLFLGAFLQICDSFLWEVMYPKCSLRLSEVMQKEILKRASKVEYSCYENPQYYNDIMLSVKNADSKVLELVILTGDFIRNIVTIIAVISIILSIDRTGLLFVGCSIVSSVYLNMKRNRYAYSKDVEIVQYNRKKDYIKRVFYFRDYAKELRFGNIRTMLKLDFSKTNQQLVNIVKRYYPKFLINNFFQSFVLGDLIIDFLYMIVVSYKTIVLKVISYGSVTAITGGLWNIKNKSQALIDNVIKFHECSLYFEKYKKFLSNNDTSIKKDYVPMPKDQAIIQLEHVSFRYPWARELSIRDVSMTIHPGEKIALVGYNGAGKTTLIKLILRLYDPETGVIKLNGVDIREYDIYEYWKYFGTVFQDYQLFSMSVAENIIMDKNRVIQQDDILEALSASGLLTYINSLPEKTETQITKEFYDEGTNLSGGEAQKLAIARAFLSKCKMYIFDEPTSALDPISDTQVTDSIRRVSNEKMVIFITHRLSNTIISDKIFMFEEGHIIEEGTHDDLMKLRGKYCEMFLAQSKKYNRKS